MAMHVRPVLAANWKMNNGPTAAAAFLDVFLAKHGACDDRTIILFPPALTLAAVQAGLAGRADIGVGVQNIHAEEKGAYTGESSAAIAVDAGATYVLVGHSERRHVFGETDDETARKCARAVQHGLTAVLCVGEKIEQREASETEAVVLRQLQAGLSALAPDAIRAIIIAYEPVWAIGTGRTATPDDAAAVHRVIRAALCELVGDDGHAIPILYGGSVTPANVAALLAADEVDGVLVGGASLDPLGWAAICAA
ncbi:MAG: Triosephosphate isomerase, bacterial/eukaryotic [Gemmatimonadetes bacterium]|nr:Triosephosphate isomerase, bacterial/eukaryotic [Gemmatimonadota bacterium]